MLIQSFRLEVETSTHSVQEFEYEAIAYLDVDLSPVLPYLNARLSRGVYLPKRPVLSWRFEGHNIGFWPDRIAVEHLHSRAEADEWVARLVALVNDTWQKRDQIEPDHSTHERLQPLQLYRLLPGTNCKACGEASCFNLALKLAAGQVGLELCTPLAQDATYAARWQQLASLIATRWPAL
ncbi:MAG TPA: (Fe-S)-binding protein [Anaerolineae bacterium]|nr:(Fe-S)-binding protein [Anaerolineae bacterium]